MSFILRPLGTVAAAALASTGVGLPLALGIGAVVTGVGNGVADVIDKNKQNAEADQAAAQAKREADAKIEAQRLEAEARAREVARELQRQKDQASLPGKVVDACQNRRLDEIPGLLQRLDSQQFSALGLTPLAACPDAETRQRVLEMIQAEQARRNV